MTMKDFREGRCVAVFGNRAELVFFVERCRKLGMGFGPKLVARVPFGVSNDVRARSIGLICKGNRLFASNAESFGNRAIAPAVTIKEV